MYILQGDIGAGMEVLEGLMMFSTCLFILMGSFCLFMLGALIYGSIKGR